MKFANKKLVLVILSILLLCFASSLKLKLQQVGVEQQDIAMNIYNNASEFIAASDVNLQLKQKQELVNGTNRYVGYWEVQILQTKNNTSPLFQDQLPNFGKQIDAHRVHIDFRYIMGCNFDVIEESNTIKTKFQMMSKESTSQHVYNLEFILPSKDNRVEEVQKYFDGVQKICFSSQETANLIKGELSALLKENLAIKKKHFKKIKIEKKKKLKKKGIMENTAAGADFNSTQLSNETSFNGTNPNPVATIINPSNPVIKSVKLTSEDITDPNVKTHMAKLIATIKSEKAKIVRLKEEKNRLLKRANELLDRMDNDNQQLSVIVPKYEEYEKHSISANQTIHQSKENIVSLNSTITQLKSSLASLEAKKIESEKKIKDMEDQYNNIKADLNSALDEENNIRKKISDLEAKSNVETENLSVIETKKKIILEKIKDLTAEIKKDGDDIDSNQKNLGLIQTNFNNLEGEKKKIEKNIQEIDEKLHDLKKKENDIKKNINPKNLSTMETQKETTVSQLSQLEKILIKKRDDVLKIIDPQFADIVEKAFDDIANKNNFDPESYVSVLKTLPNFIWEIPAKKK